MHRREMLFGGTALAALAAGSAWWQISKPTHAMATEGTFEIELSDAEWKKRLTPAQFNILRQGGTERPFSSPLNDEHRAGTFSCAGCNLDLYSSETKFDSGTGWPSFYRPLPNAVQTSADNLLFLSRTEVHCRRCGGHLGHVFDDGPKPTGKRYCMDGLAMNFTPA